MTFDPVFENKLTIWRTNPFKKLDLTWFEVRIDIAPTSEAFLSIATGKEEDGPVTHHAETPMEPWQMRTLAKSLEAAAEFMESRKPDWEE